MLFGLLLRAGQCGDVNIERFDRLHEQSIYFRMVSKVYRSSISCLSLSSTALLTTSLLTQSTNSEKSSFPPNSLPAQPRSRSPSAYSTLTPTDSDQSLRSPLPAIEFVSTMSGRNTSVEESIKFVVYIARSVSTKTATGAVDLKRRRRATRGGVSNWES